MGRGRGLVGPTPVCLKRVCRQMAERGKGLVLFDVAHCFLDACHRVGPIQNRGGRGVAEVFRHPVGYPVRHLCLQTDWALCLGSVGFPISGLVRFSFRL